MGVRGEEKTIMPVRNPFAARIASCALAMGAGLFMTAASAAEAQDFAVLEPAGRTHTSVPMRQGPALAQIRADLGKGFDLLRSGKPVRAVAYFDRVIAAFDRDLAGDGRQRLCAASSGHEDAPRNAVLLDDAVCDAHFGRGFALIDMGRGDLAEADLRAASEMEPGNAHFANEYAELFKSRRDWETAFALFEKAWGVADKTMGGPDADLAARALRGMGYCRAKMGGLAEAKRLLEQSLTYEPDSEAARIELDHIARMAIIGA